MNILSKKLEPEVHEVMRQAIMNQNILVLDQHIRTKRGVPQGSAWSPAMFNIYLDSVIDILKGRIPDLKLICYADDI